MLIVIKLPADTLEAAVAVHWLPAVVVVLQVARTLPAVQVVVELAGVTAVMFHVSATPTYEVTVMLGLHEAGA